MSIGMNNKNKIRLIITLAVILLLSMYFASCAAPVIHTPSDWSFRFTFPFWGFPFGLIALTLYVLPTIIAAVRRHRSILGILLVNILTGWTFIGWVIALVWSLAGKA
jgi:hypothetical protein